MAQAASRPTPPTGFKRRPMPPPGFHPSGPVPQVEQSFEESDPSVGQRIGARIFGTDVEDPRPYTRLGTIITGALAGTAVGAKGGAAVGTAVGGPPGTIAGGAVGAIGGGLAGTVAGAIAPEVVMEVAEKLGVARPGFRDEFGLNDEELVTVLKGEALLDAATMGGVAAARLTGRGVINMWTGASKSSRLTAEAAARENINLMPVQVGSRTMPRGFVAVFGRFPFVATMLRKRGQAIEGSIHDAFSELPTRIAVPASMSDVSSEIFTNFKTLAGDIHSQFKKEYEEIFKSADLMNVKIRPQTTLDTVDAVLDSIAKGTPSAGPGQPVPEAARSLLTLRKFIVKSIKPIRGDGDVLAPQTLTQMDALMETVDQRIADFVRQEQGLPIKYLTQIRDAIHTDLMTLGKGKIGQAGFVSQEEGWKLTATAGNNRSPWRMGPAAVQFNNQIFTGASHSDAVQQAIAAFGPGVQRAIDADPEKFLGHLTDPAAPRDIGRRLRALDERFSATMTDVLENATANRVGTINRRGVKGFSMPQATRTHIQGLADILMQGNSVETITDLEKMIEPGTMKRLAASVLDRRLRAAVDVSPQGSQFNLNNFSRSMGIGDPAGARYLQTKKLLETAGGLTIKEVEQFMDYAKAAASVEIPDVSSFIARRAGIGGIRSVTSALVPGLAAAGGAGAGRKSWAQIALGGIMFIAGGKGIARAISDPNTARALRYVLHSEASRVSRHAALYQLFRGTTFALKDAGDWTEEQLKDGDSITDIFMDSVEQFDEQ